MRKRDKFNMLADPFEEKEKADKEKKRPTKGKAGAL